MGKNKAVRGRDDASNCHHHKPKAKKNQPSRNRHKAGSKLANNTEQKSIEVKPDFTSDSTSETSASNAMPAPGFKLKHSEPTLLGNAQVCSSLKIL